MEKNKPFKLEEFSKKESFSVPDGYFDKLPSVIQAKAIESTNRKSIISIVSTSKTLRLAIPSLLFVVFAVYFGYKYQNDPVRLDSKIETMLADVSTEEMVNYLDQTDLSSDDFLELVSFEGEKIDDFSNDLGNVSDEELETLINEYEIEDLNI